jgi:hypothetical protein
VRRLIAFHWQSSVTTFAGPAAVGPFAERALSEEFDAAKQRVVGSAKVTSDGLTDAHRHV